MDSAECFDENKVYLKNRIEIEENPAVRTLLQQDFEFLDMTQIEMSTAREFFFIARFRGETQEQRFAAVNRTQKTIREQGFETKCAGREDLKRMLSIYFEQNANGILPSEQDWQFAMIKTSKRGDTYETV